MPRPLSAKAEIVQMKATGNFFTKNVSKTIMGNTLDMVEWLVGQGEKMYRAGLPADTGFTREHIEGFTAKRTQLVTGRSIQSRFGKIRLGGESGRVSRSVTAGTASKYGPERRPHITLWTLETGAHGAHPRKAHRAARKARNRLAVYQRTIRRDLAKGLH